MIRAGKDWLRAGAVCAAVLSCGVGLPGARAADAPAPEPLETELIRARNMIINASSKIRNDVLGFAPGDGAATPTTARSCCSANLEQIEAAVRESARILKEFDSCYERRGDTDMVLRARVALSDLAYFAQAVPYFAEARTKREAQAALQEMGRAFNTLRTNAAGLDACEDVARRPPADPSAVEAAPDASAKSVSKKDAKKKAKQDE